MLCILLMYLIPPNRVKLKSSLFRGNKLISCQYCKVSLLCMTSAKKKILITTYKIKLFLPFISDKLISGGSHMKGAGMLVGNFELNPERRPIWA